MPLVNKPVTGFSDNGFLAGMNGIQAVSAFGSAYAASESARTQGWYANKMYELNARMADFQGEDAVKRGDKAAKKAIRGGKGLIGRQRAAMAAQGIEIDSGSALEVQEDTAAAAAEDALTIKNNAWREAWGFRVQAAGYAAQGSMAQMAGNNEARNTLMTGGLNAINYGSKAAYYADKR